MSKSASYIAVDLGAESGRAMVFAVEDGKVSVEEHHRFASKPVLLAGHMYWDIARIFDEVKAGVRKAAQDAGEVRSLAIDTWGVDFGFLSASGEPLGLPFAYRDHKNDGMLEVVREAMADDELYGLTGIQFMQLNTLYQLVALKRMGYPLLDCASKLLFIPDLLNYLFSGQAVAEYTIASTSQLLDPVNKVWEKRIFDRLDLPLDIMPEIVESGADLGLVLPEQAEDMGIPRLRVRTCAGHDTGSAVVAVPALSDGKTWGFISAGTWCLVGLEVPRPVLGPDALAANVTNEGGVCNTIRLLKNVTGMWLVQRLRVDLEKRGVTMDYGELMKAAEAAPAFRRFINPNDAAFLNPPSMMMAIDDYCVTTSQPTPQNPAEYARCIFESLAFAYREVFSNLAHLAGTTVERIHVIGGGARNTFLNACTADACGVEVIAGPYEATALGNGIIQAMADGVFGSLAEARAAVAASFDLGRWQPTKADEWAAQYDRYLEITGGTRFKV
jgi:rhamnulokinase